MSKSPVPGAGSQAANAPRVDLRTRLGDFPHKRGDVLKALSGASPSVAQLGLGLKLSMFKRQVVQGIKLALVNHNKANADKAIRSLGK